MEGTSKMEEHCVCCDRPSERLKEYPVLNVSVCEGCRSTLDRLGGSQLSRVAGEITSDMKFRFLDATRRMRAPKKKG